MAMPSIPAEVMAEVQVVAKKAYKHAERLLEREWRARFGRRWAFSDDYYSADEDYGEAYAFAGWAAEEVLRRHGFPNIDDHAYVYWEGEKILLEDYR